MQSVTLGLAPGALVSRGIIVVRATRPNLQVVAEALCGVSDVHQVAGLGRAELELARRFPAHVVRLVEQPHSARCLGDVSTAHLSSWRWPRSGVNNPSVCHFLRGGRELLKRRTKGIRTVVQLAELPAIPLRIVA